MGKQWILREEIYIRVIYKGVGEKSNRIELPNSIRALQASVGGAVQIDKFVEEAAVASNAFAMDKCLPFNCNFLGRDWFGPVLIIGFDGCNFCSLTEEEMKLLEEAIKNKEEI